MTSKPFSCSVCQMGFSFVGGLYKHIPLCSKLGAFPEQSNHDGDESSVDDGAISDSEQLQDDEDESSLDDGDGQFAAYGSSDDSEESAEDIQLEYPSSASLRYDGERLQDDERQNATDHSFLDRLEMSQDDQQNITTSDCFIEDEDSSLGNQVTLSHVKHGGSLGVDVSSTSGYLEKHIGIDRVERGFACDICGKVFPHAHRMNAHRYHHVKRWRNSEWSRNKNKAALYRKSYALPVHSADLKNKHDFQFQKSLHTDAEQLACSFCEEQFSCYTDMRMHERQHYSLKRYSCAECGVSYLDAEWLQTQRFDRVHVNGNSCANLPKSFINMPQIKKTITGNNVLHSSKKQLVAHGYSIRNPFVFIDCSACCAGISITKGLHSGYEHQLFDNSSKSDVSHNNNINNNNNSNNSITSPVNFANLSNKKMLRGNAIKCSDCGQLFSVEDDLKIHQLYAAEMCAASGSVNTMVTSVLSETAHKGMECVYCGKVFMKRIWLNRHTRTHSKVGLYECPRCGLKITDSSNWKKHSKSRTCIAAFKNRRETLHACDVCGQRFIDKGQLKKHCKRHHL